MELDMMAFTAVKRILLITEAADLRKSIDGLSLITKEYEEDPFDGSVYIFCNKNRNRMKILHWDHNGYWIYYKRLERGRYKIRQQQGIEELSQRNFENLLRGLPYKKQIGHKEVKERILG